MAKGDSFGGLNPVGGASGLATIMARRSAPRPNDATGYGGPSPIMNGPTPRPMLPPMGSNMNMDNAMAPVGGGVNAQPTRPMIPADIFGNAKGWQANPLAFTGPGPTIDSSAGVGRLGTESNPNTGIAGMNKKRLEYFSG